MEKSLEDGMCCEIPRMFSNKKGWLRAELPLTLDVLIYFTLCSIDLKRWPSTDAFGKISKT